ncbi:hypothetical protein N7517_004695 [Penicillium concentricum]|uniref:Uncharacterized protein n=1 Tax=Penicillium concentricum TaxID=293559 RepID=A0A9W9S810_9EURO|nr:uncharacterized protein N7517_004695 [Penicillium concentricum]KAJ5372689.1 hypothetical protein N7517_004695 [Penicillium concentricum]
MRELGSVKILLLTFLGLGMLNATMIKPVAESAIYRLAGLGGILAGQTIALKPEGNARDTPQPHVWTLRSGVYTPRQVVEGFAPLLDTVVYRLGEDVPNTRSARALLLDNVASNLATHTRESTLSFQKDVPDLSRREMKEQADRIGKALVKWAREASNGPFEPELNIRSPCENHLLTPVNVDLMFGPRSQPHLMQLFNEYMHQMVLLRDALLPFLNFDEVLIPIDGKAARGIRHVEPSRAQFLTTLVTKSVTQVSVLAHAKALLAPDLPRTDTGGYAFQYEHGTILPAVLSGGDTHFHLLEYVPAKFDPSQKNILFDYEFSDYYTAPRPEIAPGSQVQAEDLLKFPSESTSSVVQNASLGLVPSTESTPVRQLELRLEFNSGKCVGVDVGQIARGHRYAYQALVGKEADLPAQHAIVHSALDILLHPDRGLITAKHGGIHVIPTVEPIVALATLGKLYPENVVLLPQYDGVSQTEKAGKGFEPKFIIWGGVEHGGFKGRF